jgi:PTS system nitrogen regulatory IIA component
MPEATLIPPGTAVLADYTKPGLIFPALRACDAAGAIHALSQALQRQGCVPDFLRFYHAVLSREFLCSTAMNCGFAVPHARLPDLARPWFALGRSAEPIAWGARGGAPIRLVFLTATPEDDSTHYLALISALARLAHDEEAVRALLEAGDADALFAALARARVRGAPLLRREPRPR